MSKRIESSLLAVLAMGLLLTCAATGQAAQQPDIAWSAEFDTAGDLAGAKTSFQPRGSQSKGEEVTINHFKDGALVFGVKPTDGNKGNVNLLWGNNRWWKTPKSEWGPYDLKDYPIVEVKFRSESARPLMYWDITDNNGEGGAFYTAATYQKFIDVEDERGKWQIVNYRISPDSSVPTKYTMRKLNGINFAVFATPDKPQEFEIDYIRLRGFTEEERAAEQEKIDLLSNWPKRDYFDAYPQFKEFFPI